MDTIRQQLSAARRIVVKVGSSLLTDGGRALDRRFIGILAAEIDALRREGREVALVTSGAVAAGVGALGIARPREIRMKQAAAAVGQSRLMHAYEEAFGALGVQVAQVLVTHDDLANRRRFLNARNTLSALFELEVVPVFNENDTVVVEEIKVGDNDNLSSLVASLIGAELLVILSDIEGLFDADPRSNSQAKRIPFVPRIDARITRLAGGSGSAAGTGGMVTKLEAARKAAAYGIPTVIAQGMTEKVLTRIVGGEDIGTLFSATGDRLAGRKHWIAFSVKPTGRLVVDSGAVKALREGKRSLLPSGILRAEGKFARGDALAVCDESGQEFARGLSDYGTDEVLRIAGKQSSEIENILGYKYSDVVIHRDDLVMLDADAS